MNFELGKTYIVDVTEKGIIPSMEFDDSKWYDKDHDDLDFLTNEEKIVVINDVLDKIKEEIKDNTYFINETTEKEGIDFETVEKIINKYKAESEDKE